MVNVAVVGLGFMGVTHLKAYAQLKGVRVAALCDAARLPVNGDFSTISGNLPGWEAPKIDLAGVKLTKDLAEVLADPSIDLVDLCVPTPAHLKLATLALQSGKHVVCEKPLCMTLEEADQMIDICRRKGVLLMYAEELFFTPKYVKAKQMADDGAFGKVYMVKQLEKHFGPHAPWFWDVRRSGGGVFMDMGCHGIAFCYWFLGRPKIKSVLCHLGTYVHGDKTEGDDEAICILDFENGAKGVVEDSWARRGGMEDRVEVYGEGGMTYADLHMGNALPTYSEYGYGYAVEKAPSTKGWSWPVFEELWNYGFPQEMHHFARCVRGKDTPQATGEDGRLVQEVLFAGYQSAGIGARVDLPFRPPVGTERPIDLWLRNRAGR